MSIGVAGLVRVLHCSRDESGRLPSMHKTRLGNTLLLLVVIAMVRVPYDFVEWAWQDEGRIGGDVFIDWLQGRGPLYDWLQGEGPLYTRLMDGWCEHWYLARPWAAVLHGLASFGLWCLQAGLWPLAALSLLGIVLGVPSLVWTVVWTIDEGGAFNTITGSLQTLLVFLLALQAFSLRRSMIRDATIKTVQTGGQVLL